MKNLSTTRISHLYEYDPLVLLNLRRLPARVNVRGASALLNFEPVAIMMLVALGFLKPLGNPHGSKHKYFSSITLLGLSEDKKWLERTPAEAPAAPPQSPVIRCPGNPEGRNRSSGYAHRLKERKRYANRLSD
jgi:hypothetical protein